MMHHLPVTVQGCNEESAVSFPDGHRGNGRGSFRRHSTTSSRAVSKENAEGHYGAASIAESRNVTPSSPQPDNTDSTQGGPPSNVVNISDDKASLNVLGQGLLESSQSSQWPAKLNQATPSASTSPQRMYRRFSCPSGGEASASSSKESLQARRRSADVNFDATLGMDTTNLGTWKSSQSHGDKHHHLVLPPKRPSSSAQSCSSGRYFSAASSRTSSKESAQGARQGGDAASGNEETALQVYGQGLCDVTMPAPLSTDCAPSCPSGGLKLWPDTSASDDDATSLNICGRKASIHGASDSIESCIKVYAPTLNSLLPTIEKLEKDRQRSQRVAQARSKLACASKLLGTLMATGKGFWTDYQNTAEDDARNLRPSWQWEVAVARRATEKQPPMDVGDAEVETEESEQAMPTLLQRKEPGKASKHNAAVKTRLHQGLPCVPTGRRGRSSSLSPARNTRSKSRSPGSGSGKGSRSGSRGGRSGSRGSSQGKKSRKRDGDGDEEDDATTPEELDEFLAQVFQEYALVWDKSGRPLMNNPALRQFFLAFIGGNNAVVLAKADQCYVEEIERQEHMHYSFDLSKKDAGRGLCYRLFEMLLQKILPGGQSKDLCRQHFLEFQGSAALMRERLSGDFKCA